MAESQNLRLKAREIMATTSPEGLEIFVEQLFSREETLEFQMAVSVWNLCVAYFPNLVTLKLLKLYQSSSTDMVRSRSIVLLSDALAKLRSGGGELSLDALYEIKPLVISCIEKQETIEANIRILSGIVSFVAYNVKMLDNGGWDELSDCILSLAEKEALKAFLVFIYLPPVYLSFIKRFINRISVLAQTLLRIPEKVRPQDWALGLKTLVKAGIQLLGTEERLDGFCEKKIVSALVKYASELTKKGMEQFLAQGLECLMGFLAQDNIYFGYNQDQCDFVSAVVSSLEQVLSHTKTTDNSPATPPETPTSLSKSPRRHASSGDTNLPLELIVEILKKLPGKSLVRFQCVSKQWSSIISRRRDFINSVIARSLTQPPRDAYLVLDYNYKDYVISFSSSGCPPETDQVLVLPSMYERLRQYVRGLFFYSSDDYRKGQAIYNPTTRQTFYFPEATIPEIASFYFGYDPVEDQYKALYIPLGKMVQACQVFTLGDRTWRTIRGVKESHMPMASVVCVNGVIYYVAEFSACTYRLMSFDVRSEKFDLVEAPQVFATLVNYQGKLGFVWYNNNSLEIWVLEDAKKGMQGWCRILLHEMEVIVGSCRVLGATLGGEIVFVYWEDDLADHMLRVLYYDPKRKSTRYVDLTHTIPPRRRYFAAYVWAISNHVENTMCLCRAF